MPMNTDLNKVKEKGFNELLYRLLTLRPNEVSDDFIRICYQQGFIDGTSVMQDILSARIDKLEDQAD